MNEKLRERLEKFDEDEDWSGMDIEDLERITNYTLEALRDHLKEDIEHAHSEAAIVSEALELISTHLAV